jgi:hypothetical protein
MKSSPGPAARSARRLGSAARLGSARRLYTKAALVVVEKSWSFHSFELLLLCDQLVAVASIMGLMDPHGPSWCLCVPIHPPEPPPWVGSAAQLGGSSARLGSAARIGGSARRLARPLGSAARRGGSDMRLVSAAQLGGSAARLGMAARLGGAARRLGR